MKNAVFVLVMTVAGVSFYSNIKNACGCSEADRSPFRTMTNYIGDSVQATTTNGTRSGAWSVDTNWCSSTGSIHWNIGCTGVVEIARVTPTKLVMGPVEIDGSTGRVTIEEGVTLDEASREFWRRVEQAYPVLFVDKVKKE